MSQALPASMTSEEYLVWEARQERKWEFDGVRPVAMTGGTFAHGTVQGNITIALRARLRGGRCRAAGPDMRVPTVPGHYRYPDAVVTCSPVSADAVEFPEPAVIFEVLSPSTSEVDRTVKLSEYCSVPSLRRYVMLEQNRPFATVIERSDHGWSLILLRLEDTLGMPELGIEVPMSELYAEVEFTGLVDK